MKRNLSLLTLAISSVLPLSAYADINDIVIARYYMGYSNNKAIEIQNIGNEAHTFVNTQLYMDGFSGSASSNKPISFQEINVLNGRTLNPGESFLVMHGSTHDDIKAALPANLEQRVEVGLAFNGDDAVFIAEGIVPKAAAQDKAAYINDAADQAEIRAAIHDMVGVVDSDVANTSGKNYRKTFVRNTAENSTPSKVWNENDWTAYVNTSATDTEGMADLGSGILDGDYTPPPLPKVCTDAVGIDKVATYEVQGSGNKSPLIESGFKSQKEYLVEGVIVGVTTGLTKGYYIQDKNGDGDPETSDGLFVYFPGADAQYLNQTACFRGKVEEYYNFTQLTDTGGLLEIVDSSTTNIAATKLEFIESDKREDGEYSFSRMMERHESMLVEIPKDLDMRVARTFGFDYGPYRNNMVLSYGKVAMHPNQLAPAGSAEAIAANKDNQDRRLYIESDAKAADGEIPYFPAWTADPTKNPIRIGNSIYGLKGVIAYDFNEYRLIPNNTITYSNVVFNEHKRPATPSLKTAVADDEFTLRLGSKNVLNFFNSPFQGDVNTHGFNRGAESQVEFDLQKAKIVEALYGMNADVIGLMEMENNGFGHYGAIKELLDALNAKYKEDRYSQRHTQNYIGNRYSFVAYDANKDRVIDKNDTIGSDAITTGLFYRPSKLTLDEAEVILMPRQEAPAVTDEFGNIATNSKGELIGSGRAYQRDALTATFLVHNTGKKITVSVHHLKSKGSECWEDLQNLDSKGAVIDADLQGNCENFRVAAAVHLGEQMAKRYPNNDRVIMGDLNSYLHEDPMLVLTSNPTNKTLRAARNTWVGNQPQFGDNGAVITKTFDYTHAVDYVDQRDNRQPSWSYSYNDEVGSLDHVLVSSGLKARIVDAIDWNINSSEAPLFEYGKKNSGNAPAKFHGGTDHVGYSDVIATQYRSSDHDPVLVALKYKKAEAGSEPVRLVADSSRVDVPFTLNDAKVGDIATLSISGLASTASPQIPQVEVKKDGKQSIFFNVANLPTSKDNYTFTMTLKRVVVDPDALTALANAPVQWEVVQTSSFDGKVAKADTIGEAKVPTPSYDDTGSGGSLGLGALLALLGLGFIRRRV